MIETKLILTKPICFFDTETTGLDTLNDRIIEISIYRINPDGTYDTKNMIFNPEERIVDPTATEKHGLTMEVLKNKPTFKSKAEELYNFFLGCDLGGYNIASYDIPILQEEFFRSMGKLLPLKDVRILDNRVLEIKLEPRDLGSLYKRYTGKEIDNAHRAAKDVEATIELLDAQLIKHGVEGDLDKLVELTGNLNPYWDAYKKFSLNEEGEPVFNFGNKYRGKTLKEVLMNDYDYVKWIIEKMDSLSNIVKQQICDYAANLERIMNKQEVSIKEGDFWDVNKKFVWNGKEPIFQKGRYAGKSLKWIYDNDPTYVTNFFKKQENFDYPQIEKYLEIC